MNAKVILSCGSIFLLSVLLTYLVRAYALHKSILDIPNKRSSHKMPTPRGGGIAIVLTFLLSVCYMGYVKKIDLNLVLALSGGGVMVALIGWLDDIYSVKPFIRFFIHFLAATWAVYWLHGFPILALGTLKVSLHSLGSLLAILGIIWCINFYNFMDGIDGLAASEGIFVSMSAALALWIIGAPLLAFLFLLLTASISGFALWNFPPAKIFLGDAGSGFIGFVFSTLALYTANQKYLPMLFWCLILAIFLLDATFTLIHRILKKQKLYEAHRQHAYQHLIAYGASHKQVTFGIFILNCIVLLPAAFYILYFPDQSILLAGSIIIFLWMLWIRIKFHHSIPPK